MSEPNRAKALLKPAEVAQLLSVSLPTVKRMLAAGDLKSVKLGRSRRIPAEAVDDLISRGWGGRR